jgi:hypothetical protein
MQCAERRDRHLWCTDLEAGTIDRIDLPRRHDRHIARCQFDVYELARRAPLDLNAARASPTQRMPAIVDGDILPDMGRMTARLHLGAATHCSAAAKAAPRAGRSWPRWSTRGSSTNSTRRPIWPTCWSASSRGRPRATSCTSSLPGTGRLPATALHGLPHEPASSPGAVRNGRGDAAPGA